MKHFITLLSFCVAIFITSCGEKTKTTTITGTISGTDAKEITYAAPKDGTSYPYFRDTLQVDDNGRFTVEMELSQPGFITFFLSHDLVGAGAKKEVTVPVLPGKSLSLDIKIQNYDAKYEVRGEDERAINAYLNLPVFSVFYDAPRDFAGKTITEIVNTVKDEKENEIAVFDQLKDNKAISADMYKMIRTDRDCYWALVTIYSTLGTFNPSDIDQEMRNIFEDIYTHYLPDRNGLEVSPAWFNYTDFYIMLSGFLNNEIDMETMSQLYAEGKMHTFKLDEAAKKLSGKQLELFRAAYLYVEGIQKNYEKELITLYDRFVNDYPESEYTPYIRQGIEDIRIYHERVSGPAKETIRIMENQERISTLKEAIVSFKGKKLYIDVWATWCGPCKAEFAHKDKFHAWTKANDYEVLYISIDDDNRMAKWEEMIKYYDLEGYHIKASAGLVDDLRQIYGQGGGLSIPWYIEVGEDGNIHELRARRPSQIVREE